MSFLSRRQFVQAPVALSLAGVLARLPGARVVHAQRAAYDLIDFGVSERLDNPDGRGVRSEDASDVNNDGVVAGNRIIDGRMAPATWTITGELTPLPAEAFGGIAYGLNDTGLVVGALLGSIVSHERPAYWRDGELVPLPVPDGIGEQVVGLAADVNESGTIVGWAGPADEDGETLEWTPLRWVDDVVEVLPVPAGARSAGAIHIGADGMIGGSALVDGPDGTAVRRPVVWRGDDVRLLELPEERLAAWSANTFGIDATGRVLVTAIGEGSTMALSWLYDGDEAVELPGIARTDIWMQALGINGAGVVVGYIAGGFTGTGRAAIWIDGQPAELGGMIPADTGLTLLRPTAISDTGIILSSAEDSDGELHQVLLVPRG